MIGSALRIRRRLIERIQAHGAAAYPHECCGAVFGRDGAPGREALELLPLTNRREDSSRNRFEITPEDVCRAEKTARELGLELIGWYHSHPDCAARPSEYDRSHAWPWYSYLILSVEAHRPRELHSWRLADDRAVFAPESVEIVSETVA